MSQAAFKRESAGRAEARPTDAVEARGFEPRSEIRFTTASTCVAHYSMFPPAGQWTADRRMIPLELRPLAEDAPSRLSRICDTRDVAPGGLHLGHSA